MNPLDVMNQVRQRQGREPINPFTIDGFGEGTEPAPRTEAEIIADVRQEAKQGPMYEPDEERLGDTAVPASPLIPVTLKVTPQAPPQIVPTLPQGAEALLELMVVGEEAVYRGNPVKLDVQDQNAIATIILRAAQRRVNEQLAQVAGGSAKTGRRRERVMGVSPGKGTVPATDAAPSAPKRRGRPKGSKNKPKPAPEVT